jgi:hypothetical protein
MFSQASDSRGSRRLPQWCAGLAGEGGGQLGEDPVRANGLCELWASAIVMDRYGGNRGFRAAVMASWRRAASRRPGVREHQARLWPDDSCQPVRFQNSATGPDLVYAARSYSLMRPPRMGRRWIRSCERLATSGRAGWAELSASMGTPSVVVGSDGGQPVRIEGSGSLAAPAAAPFRSMPRPRQCVAHQPGQCCQDRLVGPIRPGPGYLTVRHHHLVTKHQDLRVLRRLAPAQQDQPAEHPDHDQVPRLSLLRRVLRRYRPSGSKNRHPATRHDMGKTARRTLPMKETAGRKVKYKPISTMSACLQAKPGIQTPRREREEHRAKGGERYYVG